MANQIQSIQEYFEQLKEFDEDFKRSRFFLPATNEWINKFEKEHNIQIPESYKQWLCLSNGGYLIGGSVHLYGIYNDPEPFIGDDFSNGMVPKEYLILGYFESEHICFNEENKKFFFYEYSRQADWERGTFKDTDNWIIIKGMTEESALIEAERKVLE